MSFLDAPHVPIGAAEDFPPRAWLGNGLDLTTATPGDITSITQAVKSAIRLITLSKKIEEEKFKCGVTWKVPQNIVASDDVRSGTASYNSYSSGVEAFSAFQADASLSAKYMAVSGSVSAGASINKMFTKNYAYAFFSYNANLINVMIDEWANSIAEESLAARLKNIPEFKAEPDVVAHYRSWFKAVGTHVITGCQYGARFQLNVWASNSSQSQKNSFNVNISAEYNGVSTGGKFDGSVKSSSEFKEFSKSVQKTCSCQGGDPSKAGAIAASPEDADIYKSYQSWVQTAGTSPNVMSVETTALWDMLRLAIDPKLQARAKDFEAAFKYIVANPAPHITRCRFVVNSDWAEIGLLTPSAFIETDPASPPHKDFTVASTKVSWGKEQSRKFERQVTVDFLIRNDGSPVDIMLSHGSDGEKPGSGQCEVTINNKRYEAKGITSNTWNSVWFFSCEVDAKEV